MSITLDVLDARAQRLATLFAPIDAARAVWRGLTLIGHRASASGAMLWALPGGDYITSGEPGLEVLVAPTDVELTELGEALYG